MNALREVHDFANLSIRSDDGPAIGRAGQDDVGGSQIVPSDAATAPLLANGGLNCGKLSGSSRTVVIPRGIIGIEVTIESALRALAMNFTLSESATATRVCASAALSGACRPAK